MARHCFAERRRALFAEIVARAMLGAARDFPRWISHDECIERACDLCDVLQPETCCIKRNVGLYKQMVKSCYVSVYESLQRLSERECVIRLAFLKGLSDDEALPLVRQALQEAGAREEMASAYDRFFSLRIPS